MTQDVFLSQWPTPLFVPPALEEQFHTLGLLAYGHKMATTASSLSSSYQWTKQEGKEKIEEFSLCWGIKKNPKIKKVTAINACMGLNLCQLFSIIYIN